MQDRPWVKIKKIIIFIVESIAEVPFVPPRTPAPCSTHTQAFLGTIVCVRWLRMYTSKDGGFPANFLISEALEHQNVTRSRWTSCQATSLHPHCRSLGASRPPSHPTCHRTNTARLWPPCLGASHQARKEAQISFTRSYQSSSYRPLSPSPSLILVPEAPATLII